MFSLEEKIKAVNLVRDEHMSYRAAARACGASHETVRRWRLLLEGGGGGLRGPRARKEPPVPDLDNLPDDPEELKRIIFDMRFEMDLKQAVVDILKKDPGADPRTLSNRERALLAGALRKTYSTGWTLSSLRLAPATFYYHAKRAGKDREAELRPRVLRACLENPGWGYRRMKAALASDEEGPLVASEKRVRRIMAEEGLQPDRRRRASRYSSYSARSDASDLPNAPLREDGGHDFSAAAPNRLWLTDVTELALPSGEKAYLSPILDCFDGMLAAWAASTKPTSESLVDPSLERACRRLGPGDACTIHSDRGGHYHAKSWIRVCREHGLARSMSRKACPPDNARMEGFFGRLKMEFFDTRDWTGASAEKFLGELDAWLLRYNESRPKLSLGWMSPVQYRRSLGLAA
ncbi:IS3 family transposase [Gordonibacter pamelaeae]|uniref:IS3 family transposase n=1 Tax=Gordonibacter pamelaeae TaxID=471189 RepID=UPI0024321395|nr:IS3 family transposase [Gordonibacter pamelaeae]